MVRIRFKRERHPNGERESFGVEFEGTYMPLEPVWDASREGSLIATLITNRSLFSRKTKLRKAIDAAIILGAPEKLAQLVVNDLEVLSEALGDQVVLDSPELYHEVGSNSMHDWVSAVLTGGFRVTWVTVQP